MEEDVDDMASDVQQRSEGGMALPVVRVTVSIVKLTCSDILQPEPSPNDAPGPHYISYDSSFGNFGPLPPDDLPPQNALNAWVVSLHLPCLVSSNRPSCRILPGHRIFQMGKFLGT